MSNMTQRRNQRRDHRRNRRCGRRGSRRRNQRCNRRRNQRGSQQSVQTGDRRRGHRGRDQVEVCSLCLISSVVILQRASPWRRACLAGWLQDLQPLFDFFSRHIAKGIALEARLAWRLVARSAAHKKKYSLHRMCSFASNYGDKKCYSYFHISFIMFTLWVDRV